jgi:branched-chain amino acid transport system substrate-binding protein
MKAPITGFVSCLPRRHKLPILVTIFTLSSLMAATAAPKYSPGASDTEIKLGQTVPFSGPVSAWAPVAKVEAAYFKMINDHGGINGRKINLISLDDGYSPPKTVEQTRRLVESEEVLAIFSTVGTATNSAVQKYLNMRKVPQLFVFTGATKWGDPKQFPWTIGWVPSYKTEAEIYARYVTGSIKDPKVGILYQNDDYGKDYLNNFRAALGSNADKIIVLEKSYEASDPTIDSQIVALKTAGATVLLDITTPRFSALAIRGVSAVGWNPVHIINQAGTSIGNVLKIAGLEQSKGLISTQYLKDTTDPARADEPDVKAFLTFLTQYYPQGTNDLFSAASYSFAATMVQVLRQCGDDLTRDNVMAQATNLKSFAAPLLLSGITINTSPTDYYPIKQMQMIRFDGSSWVPFGELSGQ